MRGARLFVVLLGACAAPEVSNSADAGPGTADAKATADATIFVEDAGVDVTDADPGPLPEGPCCDVYTRWRRGQPSCSPASDAGCYATCPADAAAELCVYQCEEQCFTFPADDAGASACRSLCLVY